MKHPKDITGMTFGELKVLGFDRDEYDNTGYKQVRHYYKCECQHCGKIISVRRDHLLSGHTTSCGKENVRNTRKSSVFPEFHDDYVEVFIQGGKISFLIDPEDYLKIAHHPILMVSGGLSVKVNDQLYRIANYIMNNQTTRHIEFISGDCMDLRKSNLRIAANRPITMNYLQIRRCGNQWEMRSSAIDKDLYLGRYPTKEAAQYAGKAIVKLYNYLVRTDKLKD